LPLSYLPTAVNVIDGVSNDGQRQNAKHDEWNPQTHADQLLYNKQHDSSGPEEDRTPPQVLQG